MSLSILIATDSFKDSLPAIDVCAAIQKGILQAIPTAKVTPFPLADGGEGTLDILIEQSKGKRLFAMVNDPFFRPIEAAWGLSGDGQTAFIEMAQA